MIRLERMRLADGAGENRVEAELATSMYLGDKWEHLFALGGNAAARLRRRAARSRPALARAAAAGPLDLLGICRRASLIRRQTGPPANDRSKRAQCDYAAGTSSTVPESHGSSTTSHTESFPPLLP